MPPKAAFKSGPKGDPMSSDLIMRRLQAEDAFSGFLTEEEMGGQQQDGPAALKASEEEELAATRDAEFDAFVARMKSTRRSFFVTAAAKPQPGGSAGSGTANVFQIRSTFFDTEDEAVEYHLENENLDTLAPDVEAQVREANKALREKWMKCCRLEYGRRRRKFHTRFPSMQHFVLRYFVPLMLVAALILYLRWPLWDVLIDIETDVHLKTLELSGEATPSEIKRAYRLMVKKWHPDLNPDCGITCRSMMMKIQEAHDTLLAKGGRSNDLANKYKKALLQLRSLLFFRTFQMSAQSSDFFNMLLLTKDGFGSWLPFLASRKSTVRIVTGLTTILIFAVMEMMYVSGFNIIIILQLFYFASQSVLSSAQRAETEKISKRCNFDILRDLMFFLGPCVVCHVLHFIFLEKYPQLDQFVPQMIIGVLFLMSHLARFAPNLFDNFAFRKCSISLLYVTKPELKYSRTELIKTEIGVLFDDLFAFSSHVPLLFRVTALLVHAAYLIQMKFFPWDAPAIGNLQSRFKRQDDDNDSGTGKSAGGKKSDDRSITQQQKRPLSDKELQLFGNLDQDEVSWLSIVFYKYNQTMLRHVQSFRQSSKADELTKVECQLRATNDLKSILVILAYQKPNQPPHFEIRQTIHDPVAAKIVAREVGATSLNIVPDPRSGAADPAQVLESYKMIMGPDWDKMCSDLFRDESQVEPLHATAALKPLGIALVSAVVLLFLVAGVGHPVVPIGTEREVFDPFVPPTLVPRFGHILPDDHLLNAGGGNLAVRYADGGSLPLAGPDLYDSLRQLSMYSQEEVDLESKSVQKQAKPSKPRSKLSKEDKQRPSDEKKRKTKNSK